MKHLMIVFALATAIVFGQTPPAPAPLPIGQILTGDSSQIVLFPQDYVLMDGPLLF